ncbi:MAG: sensor domain-containing diguanylate cyclase [Candidatus Cloacimonetes bacterium]|nr:sensor domain-containing diguanylate cyclase [Candidatus Cloacimonadota bacterium]MCB5286365.1 sensor domain-containing diguanylate cyclase [Candidatus Cloacimonadota bacterium]MCK9184005.1 sensor domain-containing diguanylate cyclase [Candidatus Cloacimonadota bacterium]MCK9585029.1 sensor domain-containing diguanylate cyclase [Candidatus Cloacimonadota bacterium]MDY0228687.1 sensor domain-containing diguanylate cyclase [Candidatus Cloacimonadaceae bacterium]
MKDKDQTTIYSKIFNSTVVAIGITDINGKYMNVNPAWSNFLGYSEEEAKKLLVSDVTPKEDRKNSDLNYSLLINKKVPSIRTTRRYLCKDGQIFWADLHVTALFDEDGKLCCILGLFVNIDPQKKAEENLEKLNSQLSRTNLELQEAMKKLQAMARKDPLTSLYNRRVLEEAIETEIRRSSRSKKGLGVAMCDIDNFKIVNDTYGHDCGDIVLVQLAKVLRSNIRISDIVGRWGGEEFLLVLPETTVKGAMGVIERIRKAVSEMRINCSEKEINLTISLGMSYQSENPQRESIVAEADKALYRAKKDGKNRGYCYQELEF